MTHIPANAVRLVRSAGRALADTILPQACVGCGAWVAAECGLLCGVCRTGLATAAALPYCPRCGRSAPPAAIDADGCGRCRGEDFWNCARIVRLGPHEGLIRRLVLGLKYAGHERNADLLAEHLAAALGGRDWAAALDAFVPVPMHVLRRLQRPSNHAYLLAEALARRTGIRVRSLLRRIRYGPSQTDMPSRARRFANVAGSFALTRRARWLARGDKPLTGKTVCIVDNLLVTGATLHEVAKMLRKAGAKRIYAAVIARAVAAGDTQATSTALTSIPP